jgi:hypothetical protein
MKALLFLLVACPLASLAQDCKNFFYLTNNAQVQMTMYDKKGKENSTNTWQINNVKKIPGGYESTINTSLKDEKGKEIANGTGTYKCENGILKADARMSMPQQQAAGNSTEAKVESGYIEYPGNMSVGQSLNDVNFTMDVTSKNGMSSTVTFKENNRKVGAKESVTTPAGTWDAYVIGYDAVFRTQIAGIGIPVSFSAKEWFVPGFGVVKSETYNKGGKLMGSSQITSIKK